MSSIPRLCTIRDCGRGGKLSRGWCQMHYQRWKKHGNPLKSLNNRLPNLEDRLWPRIDRRGPDECWEWTGRRAKFGYGKLMFKQKDYSAHVAMFIVANGYRPPVVRHACDNPPCCNPAHLLPGTILDNNRDTIARGRATWIERKGEEVAGAKLTSEKVVELRRLFADEGWTYDELAKRYGVTASNVLYVVQRKTWKHVS